MPTVLVLFPPVVTVLVVSVAVVAGVVNWVTFVGVGVFVAVGRWVGVCVGVGNTSEGLGGRPSDVFGIGILVGLLGSVYTVPVVLGVIVFVLVTRVTDIGMVQIGRVVVVSGGVVGT